MIGWIWRRRRKSPTVIPRAPEPKRKRYIELSNPRGVTEADVELIEQNKSRVMLAHALGLDLALHRGQQRHEWLIAGDEPSRQNGFVIINNLDA